MAESNIDAPGLGSSSSSTRNQNINTSNIAEAFDKQATITPTAAPDKKRSFNPRRGGPRQFRGTGRGSSDSHQKKSSSTAPQQQQQSSTQASSSSAAPSSSSGGHKRGRKDTSFRRYAESRGHPDRASKYFRKRRPAPKVHIKPNDVYISGKSNIQSQIEKCKKLLDGEFHEIFVRGLDQTIPKAINIALDLKKFYQGTVDFSTNTETLQLIDDLVPLDDSTPPSFEKRIVPCVVIRVFRTVKIP